MEIAYVEIPVLNKLFFIPTSLQRGLGFQMGRVNSPLCFSRPVPVQLRFTSHPSFRTTLGHSRNCQFTCNIGNAAPKHEFTLQERACLSSVSYFLTSCLEIANRASSPADVDVESWMGGTRF